jgi:hypothetical protein
MFTADEIKQLMLIPVFDPHMITNVGPVKTADEYLCVTELKFFEDIFPRNLICRRRECYSRGIRKVMGDLIDSQVFRPEIMAPLGNTMGFVNGKKPRFNKRKEVLKIRCEESFRRDVKNIQVTVRNPFLNRPGLSKRQSRVQTGSLDAILLKCLDLVFHQRNQR